MTDYTRMIHDFVDGTLDKAAESELFASISADEGLRSELKEQLAIKDAVRNDTMAHTPAASSTVKIFSTLGFHATAAAVGAAGLSNAAVTSSSGVGGFLSGLGGKVAASIVTGLVSAALTAGIIFSTLSNSEENNSVAKTDNITTPVEQVGATASELATNKQVTNIPTTSSFANTASNANSNLNNPRVGNNSPIQKISPLMMQGSTVNDESSSLAVSDNNKHNSLSDVADNEDSQPVLTFINPTDIVSPNERIALGSSQASEQDIVDLPSADVSVDDMIILSKMTPWSIEIRGNDDAQLHKESVMPNHSPFNNTTIAVYYALYDQFSIGLEYRRENFMQKFDETDANGIITTYEQQPNFNSYGAAFRYIPEFARIDSWNLKTITQLSTGITFSGTNSSLSSIGRLMIAERFAPYPELAFIVGFEGSMLAYKHETATFTDYKFGIFYGIEINL